MNNIFRSIKAFFSPEKSGKILIIDDSAIDRLVAAKALSRHYRIVTADSGAEGVAQAIAQSPDLIVLDYMMPDMNGPQVCCVLKNDERTKNIPVIFLTSMDTPKGFISGLEQGAEAYLVKPVKVRDLQAEVRLRVSQCAVNRKD